MGMITVGVNNYTFASAIELAEASFYSLWL